MNYVTTIMKLRQSMKEEKDRKFELLENELDSICAVTEKNAEELRKIRNQRKQAQKVQAKKVTNAEKYLDFLSMKFKKLVREQHASRYQRELVTAYHQKKEDSSDDDNNNAIPLPYVLLKQAKLLRCFHLIEVYTNQCKIIYNQMKIFRQSMKQKKVIMLKCIVVPSYENQHHHGNESKEDDFVITKKQPQLSVLKLNDFMPFNKVQPFTSSPTARY